MIKVKIVLSIIWKGCISMDIETDIYCDACDKKLNEDQCVLVNDFILCYECEKDYWEMDAVLTSLEEK